MTILSLDSTILWNIVNIIVLYFLLKKFLFKPVNAMLERRAQEIKSTYAKAEQTKNEADSMREKYEASLQNAKNEAEGILFSARKKSQSEYDAVLKDADREASKKLTEAQKAIALEKAKAMRSLQSEIADIAVAAAQKAAAQSMDETAGKRLIDDFLAEAGALE